MERGMSILELVIPKISAMQKAGIPRTGDIKRLFEAVLQGDVEHIEDVIPVDAPEGFKRIATGLANIVRDYREGRITREEALRAVAKLLGVDTDPVTLILSLVGL